MKNKYIIFSIVLYLITLINNNVKAIESPALSSEKATESVSPTANEKTVEQTIQGLANMLIQTQISLGVPQKTATKISGHMLAPRKPTKECPIIDKDKINLRIMVMRHGEQPSQTDVKQGFGLGFDNDITLRGLRRAFALVPLFAPVDLIRTNVNDVKNGKFEPKYLPNYNPPTYGLPVAVYAPSVNATTPANKKYNDKNSDRSREVVQQVANQLKQNIIDKFKYILGNESDPSAWTNPDNYCDVVQDIATHAKAGSTTELPLVLVAWDHKALPALIQEIAYAFGGVNLPLDLSLDVLFHNYDRFIEITIENGKVTSIRNIAQALTYGDTAPTTSQTFGIDKSNPQEMVKTEGPEISDVLKQVITQFITLKKA